MKVWFYGGRTKDMSVPDVVAYLMEETATYDEGGDGSLIRDSNEIGALGSMLGSLVELLDEAQPGFAVRFVDRVSNLKVL